MKTSRNDTASWVGTARCAVTARVQRAEEYSNRGQSTVSMPIAPLNAAQTAQRAVPTPVAKRTRCDAFTMIEIAISLAIIGFALVAIIGILPMGMNAQRDNRQETIVNQDASILMDAVRNGERGLDDLTNYVIGITNYARDYTPRGVPGPLSVSVYTTKFGGFKNLPDQRLALTNGYIIIGILSTPKIILHPSGLGFLSNHVVAVFRSMSGPASEKPP